MAYYCGVCNCDHRYQDEVADCQRQQNYANARKEGADPQTAHERSKKR